MDRYRMLPVLLVLVMVTPTTALAYIGPGMGAGAFAAVIGVLGSILLGIFAVVYYPIKRALKGGKRQKNGPRS